MSKKKLNVLFVKLVDFARDPSNQFLATWLQTVAVVVGVIVALCQLSSVLDKAIYAKNTETLKFEEEFVDTVSRKAGLIYEYYVNLDSLSEESYLELYPLDKFLEIRESVRGYISRLSSCGVYEVCDSNKVDITVCSLSKNIYDIYSMEVTFSDRWRISFSDPVFYESMINKHCGIWDRIIFWSSKSV